jgi:hypothetical protein
MAVALRHSTGGPRDKIRAGSVTPEQTGFLSLGGSGLGPDTSSGTGATIGDTGQPTGISNSSTGLTGGPSGPGTDTSTAGRQALSDATQSQFNVPTAFATLAGLFGGPLGFLASLGMRGALHHNEGVLAARAHENIFGTRATSAAINAMPTEQDVSSLGPVSAATAAPTTQQEMGLQGPSSQLGPVAPDTENEVDIVGNVPAASEPANPAVTDPSLTGSFLDTSIGGNSTGGKTNQDIDMAVGKAPRAPDAPTAPPDATGPAAGPAAGTATGDSSTGGDPGGSTYHAGGYVPGQGDTPATLQGGEYVVPRSPLAESLRQAAPAGVGAKYPDLMRRSPIRNYIDPQAAAKGQLMNILAGMGGGGAQVQPGPNTQNAPAAQQGQPEALQPQQGMGVNPGASRSESAMYGLKRMMLEFAQPREDRGGPIQRGVQPRQP